MIKENTIAAVATGNGGAISIIRISGDSAIEIGDLIFKAKSGRRLADSQGFTIQFGQIFDKEDSLVDEVLVSVFRAPNSYTGENALEISCHGSSFIRQKILSMLIANGASMASPGEFTMRAYLNGKLDLVQAEAVADLISCQSESSHRMAINQMRGGYSKEFSVLRKELINLISLLELELDFSDEDVEFADRTELVKLLSKISERIVSLTSSFRQGNAIKNGVPVAITGKPNVGKSTLLNALLNEQRVLVSDIAGTTRDLIEECMTIAGISFRFIDTAGIRKTDDLLENMGIERALSAVSKAEIVLLIISPNDNYDDISAQITALNLAENQQLIIVVNKIDTIEKGSDTYCAAQIDNHPFFAISAKNNTGVDSLKNYLSSNYSVTSEDVVINNIRHVELLSLAESSIHRALNGIQNNIPTDFIAQDLRETMHHIGSLTAEISSDDILHNIFGSFCIGK